MSDASARDAVSDWMLDKDIRITRGSTNDLADNLIAALSAAGFVIVPREPTEAMIKAYYHAMDGTHPTAKMNPSKALVGHHIKAQKRYRAMLSAAEGKK